MYHADDHLGDHGDRYSGNDAEYQSDHDIDRIGDSSGFRYPDQCRGETLAKILCGTAEISG